jgi:hypothetical protein
MTGVRKEHSQQARGGDRDASGDPGQARHILDGAAQVQFESKIEAKLKAVYRNLVSSA